MLLLVGVVVVVLLLSCTLLQVVVAVCVTTRFSFIVEVEGVVGVVRDAHCPVEKAPTAAVDTTHLPVSVRTPLAPIISFFFFFCRQVDP